LKPESGGRNEHVWKDLRERPPGVTSVWLACSYGDSDDIVLGMRLNDSVDRCSVEYLKGGDMRIKCSW